MFCAGTLTKRMVVLSGLIVFSAVHGGPQTDDQLPPHFARCTATKKMVCVAGDCSRTESSVFILLEKKPSTNRYSRCDRMGCESYDAQVQRGGEFENWQLSEPRGVMFKRSLRDGEFLEVATLGMQAYVSTGYCTSVRR